tara:strand:+ start:537 stop:752 length:216 start_codon:yes stop_codon:yes gene_type:complete
MGSRVCKQIEGVKVIGKCFPVLSGGSVSQDIVSRRDIVEVKIYVMLVAKKEYPLYKVTDLSIGRKTSSKRS